MGGKILFWMAIAACIAYVINLVSLAAGQAFTDHAIALSFITNVVFYGMLAYGVYHAIKKEESE